MAVLVQHTTLVVRLEALEKGYPGGTERFLRFLRKRRFCVDEDLVAVNFWELWEVKRAKSDLIDSGLGGTGEVFVSRKDVRPFQECDWLFVGKNADGVVFATLEGRDRDPREIWVPAGWDMEAYLKGGVNEDRLKEPDAVLKFIGNDGEFETYLDFKTGQEIRVPVSVSKSSPIGLPNVCPRSDSEVRYLRMPEDYVRYTESRNAH